ncbi:MAG: hypothetical protein ABFS86_06935 [Planctomycetota bacterium]
MRTVVLIATLSIVGALVGCPAAGEDPGKGVRETFAQAQEFVRAGEYDKVWTLYSVEYRETLERMLVVQKKGIRDAMARKLYDVDKIAYAQTRMTAKQYLAASAREIEAAVLEVRRKYVLESRIMGKIHVEGDKAYAKVLLPPGDQPADTTFVHRNGRWLYHDRSYMPAK